MLKSVERFRPSSVRIRPLKQFRVILCQNAHLVICAPQIQILRLFLQILVFQIYTIPVFELIEVFAKTGLIYNICVHLFNLIAFLLVLRPRISNVNDDILIQTDVQNHVFGTLGISKRIFECSLKLNIEFLMTTKHS